MRKIPPLNAMKAFEAAGRHTSFTRAAEELSVSQGAVSKQVALLEEWLGTALFTRTQSQIKLTPAGEELLATLIPAFDRIALTTLRLTERSSNISSLNVNAPPTFTMRWLIPRIASFQKQHPAIEIKLTTSTAPINFLEYSYDIAIRGSHTQPEYENAIPFMTETIIPICHPHLLTNKGTPSVQSINAYTVINYDTEPMTWSEWAQAAKVVSFQPKFSLQFEQMYFALQAANEGLGIVLVPLFLVADDIATGKLCAPFGLIGARQRKYYAVSKNKPANSSIMHIFYEWLASESIETEKKMKRLLKKESVIVDK